MHMVKDLDAFIFLKLVEVYLIHFWIHTHFNYCITHQLHIKSKSCSYFDLCTWKLPTSDWLFALAALSVWLKGVVWAVFCYCIMIMEYAMIARVAIVMFSDCRCNYSTHSEQFKVVVLLMTHWQTNNIWTQIWYSKYQILFAAGSGFM